MGFNKVKSTIHVMRHGQVHNPHGVLYGQLPGYHLSEVGRAMAQAVADDFARKQYKEGSHVVYCVASPLERAQETALPIAQELELELDTDERLIEAGSKFQGQVISGSLLRHPKALMLLRNPFKPSWGEPYRVIVSRMHEAIDDARIKAIDRGGNWAEAVIVSHQLPIWVSRQAAEGRKLWHLPTRRECALASVTSFSFDGDHIVKVYYNEPAGHLVPDKLKVPDSMRTHGKNTQRAPKPLRKPKRK